MTAPKRIWMRDLDETGSMHPCIPAAPGAVEYVRLDLASGLYADLVVEHRALMRAAFDLCFVMNEGYDGKWSALWELCKDYDPTPK